MADKPDNWERALDLRIQQMQKEGFDSADIEAALPNLMTEVGQLFEARKSRRTMPPGAPPDLTPAQEGVRAGLRNLESSARGVGQAVTLGFADEGAGVVGMALGNPSAPLPERYRQGRDQYRKREAELLTDPANKAAYHTFGTVASLAMPSAGLLAQGPKARTALALGEGAVAGGGISEADLTRGQYEQAAKDLILPVAGTAALRAPGHMLERGMAPKKELRDAAGRLTQAEDVSGVERHYADQVTTDIGLGATPTHRRRASPDTGGQQMIVDLVERDPALRKATTGDRHQLAAIAEDRARSFAEQTQPIYQKLDTELGHVPKEDIVRHIQGRIDELKKGSYKQNDQLIEALEGAIEHIRRPRATDPSVPDVVTKRDRVKFEPREDKLIGMAGEPQTRARTYERVIEELPDEVTKGQQRMDHKQIREWVSGYLEQKKAQEGGINETLASQWRNELHDASHAALAERLDDYAVRRPDMAEDIKKLRQLNRDISASVRIADVARNAENQGTWQRKPLAKRIGEGAKQAGYGALAGGAMGAVGGASTGHGVGGAIAGAAVGGLLGPAMEGLSHAAIEKLGTIARAARLGRVGAQEVQDARTLGVPMATIRAIIMTASAPGNQPPPKNPHEAALIRREAQ